MADDVDTALRRLAKAPVPAALFAIEPAVLDRIERGSGAALAKLGLLGAASFAMAIGVIGGLVPSNVSTGAESLSPFGPASPLAPSSLLASKE